MKNKKGSMQDVIFIVMAVFFVSISLVMGLYLMNQAYPKIQEKIDTSPVANDSMTTVLESATYTFDYLFLAIFIGLIIALVILSFMIDVHPVFLIPAIIILAMAVVVSVPISNAFQTILAQVGEQSNFPITLFIMANLPYFTVIIGGLAMVMIYAAKKFLGLGGGGL